MIDVNEIWIKAKDKLSIAVQTVSFEVWIETLDPICFIDNRLVLATVTSSAKNMIEKKYLDTIKECVRAVNENIKDVEIILPSEKEEYLKQQTDLSKDADKIVEVENDKKNPFFERYTFDTFVSGNSNSYALAASKSVAESPGTQYNPLFIYSGVGLGKTHLLHAIGNYIYDNNPDCKVLYISAETLVNELISAIKSKSDERNVQFREKYRSCDVLMVDDIQFIIGKEATQESFFYTFNELYQKNKQIIITSDRAPKEFTTLEDRLRTRFNWGLTVDIQSPDMETKMAILKNKAIAMNFKLSDEVAEFIAENSPSNIREMEGLLNKIVFYSSLTNNPITTRAMAFEALKEFIDDKKETIEVSDIISHVCKYYRISNADIVSKKKTKNLVEARMIAIYLITDILPMPLVQIGELFGGRDHTTIIHARDKITDEIKTNERIKITVADIKNMILNR